ncbi:MAG: hypothetical protein HY746_01105 [Elusimicrobia bacterium]|nr:hypothetical protein [Elusimicrobiota bacterium]
MKWEEITKQYAKESYLNLNSGARLNKNWTNLLRSTDRLVWLFMLSNKSKLLKQN